MSLLACYFFLLVGCFRVYCMFVVCLLSFAGICCCVWLLACLLYVRCSFVVVCCCVLLVVVCCCPLFFVAIRAVAPQSEGRHRVLETCLSFVAHPVFASISCNPGALQEWGGVVDYAGVLVGLQSRDHPSDGVGHKVGSSSL